jgi:hypothetical protein
MEDDDFAVSRRAGSFHAKLVYAHLGKLLKFSAHGSEGAAQASARYTMPVHEASRVQTAFRSPGQVHLSSHSGGTCAEIVWVLIFSPRCLKSDTMRL